ncbi:MAG: sigma 54-interacting transcriptional regulator [Bdellovibrionales bacterium]|nr:sigma 54-interacting transcriptional regulator [Bdellovibrionales bacterium]
MNASRHNWLELPEDNKVLGVSKLISARMCLLGLVLAVSSYCSFYQEPHIRQLVSPLYLPIILIFAFSILSSLWVKQKSVGNIFLCIQVIVDISIITGIIWVTGGAISPFLFLYLPLVMMTSLLISRRLSVLLAVFTGTAYGVLTWGMVQGFIPTANGLPAAESPANGYILQLVALYSALILVSVLTQFLKDQLTTSRQLIKQSEHDLFTANHIQQALVSGMPDGIMMLGIDETITNINQAACELLNIEASFAEGKTIDKLLDNIDTSFEVKKLEKDIEKSVEEIKIKPLQTKKIITLASHKQKIFNDKNEITGSLIVFQNITKLRTVEQQLEMQERMARMLIESGKETGPTYTKIKSFVGESPIMQKVFKLIEKVALSEATVLVQGESGTGKELVAKAIHHGSPRSGNPFIAVNCGAIPDTLIESELFGHKKGSFTGADSDHVGLFRQASGGTIFLDEIGELPIQVQAKILRALQEKSVRPVGGDKDIPVDVRIVAATNKNLRLEVEKGEFREDLFYRLNVIGIKLPRLADRKEDIPLLVNSILTKLVKGDGLLPVVTPTTMKLLLEYNYPGNVRELENILERALVFGRDAILPEHLPDSVMKNNKQEVYTEPTQILIDEQIEFPLSLDQVLAKVERKYLEAALIKTKGAKKRAANLLGINFRSFRYRLQKYEIGDE